MKRSTQVALLLMGVTGVGAAGYAMSRPPADCVTRPRTSATEAPPALKPGQEYCPERRRWASSSYYGSNYGYSRSSYYYGSSWSRPIFSRGDPTNAAPGSPARSAGSTPPGSMALGSSTRSAPATTTTRSAPSSSSTSTSRSGFGSSASSHSSGG